ncbi:MAG: hypothetical protein IJF73_00265 [Clostridia bacterium]|nr:hypothetical protein [Clostridia bacterium]
MLYDAFSLNGKYKMDYSPDAYLSEEVPEFSKFSCKLDAIPGYWEDMTEKFERAPFYRLLQVNPEYGVQRYPIVDVAPDMALPNVMGTFFYERTLTLETLADDVTIAFPQVHNTLSAWWNGHFLGRHVGYSTHFELAVPREYLTVGENTVTFAVSNHRHKGWDDQPVSGITSRAASEYSGGISDSVALRVYRSPLRAAAVLFSEDLKTADVRVEAKRKVSFTYEVLDGTTVLRSGKADGDFTFSAEGLDPWSPDSPRLYTLRLTDGVATLDVPFGVRRLVARGLDLLLNGEPIYLAGVTEHCYYPMTVWPSRDVSYYRMVITKLKELGFNFIRFHTVVPTEQYMQAADELGILVEVESPNYTSLEEWREIVAFCRRHPSVVMYCCGNELQMEDDFIEHLRACADYMHEHTDSLFSPMNAMRGLEYAFQLEPHMMHEVVEKPVLHNPRRFRIVGEFSDVYNTVAQSAVSHRQLAPNIKGMEEAPYAIEGFFKPQLAHETAIDGTYVDLSIRDRYRGTRVGDTAKFSSIEEHLRKSGVLHKAPVYFRNSCRWQQLLRKYNFEMVRSIRAFRGFDFLGPIDTHWHTFGYDVGMMNEFYELKPGETVRNVRMYNSQTVLLADFRTNFNFAAGSELTVGLDLSLFGVKELKGAELSVRLMKGDRPYDVRRVPIAPVPVGAISRIYDYTVTLPDATEATEMRLCVSLTAEGLYTENEWPIYVYPAATPNAEGLTLGDGLTLEELLAALERGERVVVTNGGPFVKSPLSFQIAKAGRCAPDLATVIHDHPVTRKLPHEGFCGWPFRALMTEATSVVFSTNAVPYEPIVEVASSHKHVIKRAALFEFRVGEGRLLVSSFNLTWNDPIAAYYKALLFDYARSEDFCPKHSVTPEALRALAGSGYVAAARDTNISLNPNDKSSVRIKK